MKKSQLRKLIRESIKQVINEQSAPSGGIRVCKCSNVQNNSCQNFFDNLNQGQGRIFNLNGTYFYFDWMRQHLVDGAPPQVGQVIDIMGIPYLIDMVNTGIAGADFGNPNGLNNYPSMADAYGINGYGVDVGGGEYPTDTAYAGQGVFRNYSSFPNPPAGCGSGVNPPPPPPTSGGCDPNAPFPPNFNLQSWTNTWTNLPNFSSTSPNQPCNFICQRRNQWTSQLAAGGMGPKQTNMVACRLAEAENQYQIHNCATSNAPNCP